MASLSASSSSRRSSSVSTGSNSMPGADTSASTFIGSERSRNIVHLLRRSCARAGPLGVIAETLDTIIAFYRFPKGFAPQTSTSTAFRKSLSGSRLKRATCIGPAKGLGHAIEVLDKSQDLRPQIILGCEVAALDHPTHQDAEPDFDLIEPRRMLGYIHELNTVRRVTQKGRPTGHRLQHAAFA